MTEIKEFDPNALSPAEEGRSDLLRDFNQDPDNDSIWQLAYDEVRKEGNISFDDTIAGDIPTEELIGFAERIRAKSTSRGRYALTTETASNGKLWFEILETFTDPQTEEAKGVFFRTLQLKKKSPIPFQNSLEIGVGAGRSLQLLQNYSSRVVGVDNVPELLAVAKKRVWATTELVRTDAAKMPFADDSFDFIESSGVAYSLGHEAVSKLYKEVSRLLMPGGMYIESVASRDSQGRIDPDLARSYKGAKSMMAQMLVDYISGERRLNPNIGVSEEERTTIIDSLGLRYLSWMMTNYDGERVYLRGLIKPLDSKGTLPPWVGKIENVYKPITERERQAFEYLVEDGKAIRLKNGAYRGVPQSQWPQNTKE